ncbi:MAG TPA: type II secretion system F family protein [Longimicrobiaceae bacterium]|nr:type II secretion system F family protein [Longimicrobiaceae bacterium]
MSAFRYRAATPEGKIVEGVVQAPSRDGVLADLRARSLYPVAVEEALGEVSAGGGWATRGSGKARIQLTRSLATLLEAGFPVDRGLMVSAELTENAALRGAIQAIRQDVRAGRSLADAFAAHPRMFPPLYVAMIAAGEAGGTLGATFTRLADLQEEAEELRGQLVSALIYPALMLFAGGTAVGLLVFLVVPRFAGMLEDAGAELPLTTRILLGTTDFLVHWGWMLALLGAALVWAGVQASRTPEGRARRDALLLRLPVVGDLLLRLATARLTRTLGALLQNGVSLVTALEISRSTTGNEALRREVEGAVRRVREGKTLMSAVSPFLPRMATQMIGVGEESGSLPDMLLRVAGAYDREVRAMLKRAVTLVEPLLILLFGTAVGFVALGMLQAIYSINAGTF